MIRGGQGREPEDLTAAAWALSAYIVASSVLGAIWVICAQAQ